MLKIKDKVLSKAKHLTLTNAQHTKLGEYTSGQGPQERDPKSEYMDDIIDAISWWTAVAFRLFLRRRSKRQLPTLALCGALGASLFSDA